MHTKGHPHGKMGRGSGQPDFGGKSQLQQQRERERERKLITQYSHGESGSKFGSKMELR